MGTGKDSFNNYQQVEWVGASSYRINNYNAKIDLGYAPKIKPRAVFRIQEYAISTSYICGTFENWENGALKFNWYVGTSGPRYYYYYGTGSTNSGSSITISAETWYNIDISDVVYVNGSKKNTKTETDWSANTRSIMLFYGPTDNRANPTYCSSRIAYFKLYDGEDLVRDLIPCYRKNDGQVGFWDNVTEQFFTSANGNPLKKGADVI